MPFLIFAGVVLAFPSTWRQRLVGLLFGALVIHAFNTLRIITLIWVLAWKSSWFQFAHVYLWQTGTILIVFLTFALWIRTVSPRARPA
jgi:exosortase/archaeosortase family protein